MIFGEMGIIGGLGHNDIKYWNPKLLDAWALQGKFGVSKAATTIWKSQYNYQPP